MRRNCAGHLFFVYFSSDFFSFSRDNHRANTSPIVNRGRERGAPRATAACFCFPASNGLPRGDRRAARDQASDCTAPKGVKRHQKVVKRERSRKWSLDRARFLRLALNIEKHCQEHRQANHKIVNRLASPASVPFWKGPDNDLGPTPRAPTRPLCGPQGHATSAFGVSLHSSRPGCYGPRTGRWRDQNTGCSFKTTKQDRDAPCARVFVVPPPDGNEEKGHR